MMIFFSCFSSMTRQEGPMISKKKSSLFLIFFSKQSQNPSQKFGTFETNDFYLKSPEEMAEYLMGKNATKRAFVKVIEVVPEENNKVENTEK